MQTIIRTSQQIN